MTPRVACAVLAVLLLAACSAPGSPDARTTARSAPQALAAQLDAGAAGVLVLLADPRADYLDVAHRAGGVAVYRYRSIPAMVVRDRGGDAEALAARLAALPEVAAARVDRPLAAGARGAATAPVVAAVTAVGAGVAIVGTGVSPNAGVPLGRTCFSVFRAGGCDDPVGAGTAVARRAAPAGSVVYPVRVLDDDLASREAWLVAGLDWVAWSATLVSPPIRAAVVALPLERTPLLDAALAALERSGVRVLATVGPPPGATGP